MLLFDGTAIGAQRNFRHSARRMARKHSRPDPYGDLQREDEVPAAAVPCWLCGRPTGKTIVWHHPIPKSRGGRDVVPMHPICQQTLIANFTNSELQRHGMDVDGLLAKPATRRAASTTGPTVSSMPSRRLLSMALPLWSRCRRVTTGRNRYSQPRAVRRRKMMGIFWRSSIMRLTMSASCKSTALTTSRISCAAYT